LIFRHTNTSFGRILDVPFTKKSEVLYLRKLVADVKNPDRETLFQLVMDIVPEKKRGPARQPQNGTPAVCPVKRVQITGDTTPSTTISLNVSSYSTNLAEVVADFNKVCEVSGGNLSTFINGIRKMSEALGQAVAAT
jgi:hypothetical protein